MDRGDWWAIVHEVAECQTQMKWLNTHTHTKILYLWNNFWLDFKPLKMGIGIQCSALSIPFEEHINWTILVYGWHISLHYSENSPSHIGKNTFRQIRTPIIIIQTLVYFHILFWGDFLNENNNKLSWKY